MKIQDITRKLAGRKQGQAVSFIVDRPAKLYKEFKGEDIRKRSRISGQLCDYAKRAPVADAIAKGEREAPKLPRHVEKTEVIDGVKFWVGFNGQYYLPLPLFGEGGNASSEWLLNGQPVSLEEIKHKLQAEETKPKPSKKETEARGWAQTNGPKIENIADIA